MAIFQQRYVVDTSGQPVASASGRIYATSDTTFTNPLAVTDLVGVPMTEVAISEIGVNVAFVVEDHMQVIWRSSDSSTTVLFESLDGMYEAAVSAREAAISSFLQAERFAGQLGVPGGFAGLNSEGDVTDADGNVVGNDTRRPGSVIWATGAQTPRPTASDRVLVIWVTDGEEPVNALPGVDIWANRIGTVIS